MFFFFKQKTAYEIYQCDWSSDVCSSDLDWFAECYERWQAPNPEDAESFSMPTWSNTASYPGGRQDPEIIALENTFPPDKFQERFGAIPCPPSTLVFKEFSFSEHVADYVEYNKDLPVSLAVDPGYSPGKYAVLALQTHDEANGPEQVWVVDEIYASEMTGPEVVALALKRPWWGNVVGGVMDVAGRQHQAMKSQQEVWRELAGIYLRSQPVPILDGIARHRTFLRDPATGKPRLLHAPAVVGMLKEYRKYQRPKDVEGHAIRELPIDRDNHAMKAIAYWLYDRYGPVARKPRKHTRVGVIQ